jgi:hypothetical protein
MMEDTVHTSFSPPRALYNDFSTKVQDTVGSRCKGYVLFELMEAYVTGKIEVDIKKYQEKEEKKVNEHYKDFAKKKLEITN